jgi:hypothetical protein
MTEECASGFAEHPTGYFIDRGGALGVMIWPVHTVGIPSGRGFPPGAKGFLLNSVYGLPNWDPLWILRQGAVVLMRSAKDGSRVRSKENLQMQNAKGSHRRTSAEFKSSSYIADIYTSLVQSSQRAYSTQIGDG